MTDLMAVRCDRNIFTFWEHGQKWREKKETILIPTSDHGNVFKHLLDLLGGADKWVQGIGACCFRAVNQPVILTHVDRAIYKCSHL